jgi:hypothetical protein
MLYNAILLRIDPPSPAPAGDSISVRCALAAPTANELRWLQAADLSASAVLYLPMTPQAPALLAANDRLLVRLDGQSLATYIAVHVSDRIGDAIRYRQVFLIAAS